MSKFTAGGVAVPYFDRFDICEAYLAIEWDYHKGGWLRERPSNRRHHRSTDVQLTVMGFRPSASFQGFRSLSQNGREIYALLERGTASALDTKPSTW